MPLFGGKKNIGRNIKELESTGRPRKQAIAIALDVARKSGAKIPKKKESPAKKKEEKGRKSPMNIGKNPIKERGYTQD